MPRFRTLLSGQSLAPWHATYELAAQSAIEVDSAHRQPGSGRVFLSPDVEIDMDVGEVEMTPALAIWAEALAVIRQRSDRARAFATDQSERAGGNIGEQARWRMIRTRIDQIMEAPAKNARG